MKQNLFKDSLITRLGRNEMSFESFLTDGEVYLSIKRNNKIVTSYALDYIDKLLDYTVFGSDSDSNTRELSNKAMKIITANNNKIIYAISDDTKMATLARKILKKREELIEDESFDKKWNCILGKFSAILETCFNKYPENISNFRFLINFLQFCDNIMISSFFQLIVKSKREEVKSYLRLIKFQNQIIDLITKWHNGDNNDISTEGILSIYSIFNKYVENIVSDGCISPSLVQFALEFLPTNNPKIIAYQWELANNIIDTTNSSDFATLYPNALMAVKGNIELNNNPDLEKEISYFPANFPIFYAYQENALKFLSSLFSCNPSFASEIDGKQLVQALSYIYEKFPYSSVALSGVCTLMLILMKGTDIKNLVVDIFIPVIIEKIREDTRYEFQDITYSDEDSENDSKIEINNGETFNSKEEDSANDNEDIIDSNDENDSIIIEQNEEEEKEGEEETDKNLDIKNNDIKKDMSVNQRAFTLEFATQVMEMCMCNDDLKNKMSEYQDFLEVCIPKIVKVSSFISNDYGGMCFMPNMIRYSNMDTLKLMNLDVSVNI